MSQLTYLEAGAHDEGVSFLPPHVYPEENYLTWGEVSACTEGRENDIVHYVLRYHGERKSNHKKPFYLFAQALRMRDPHTVKTLSSSLCAENPVSVLYQTERSLLEIARRWNLLGVQP